MNSQIVERVDQYLVTLSDRTIVPTGEVTDLLLDIRNLAVEAKKPLDPAPELVPV